MTTQELAQHSAWGLIQIALSRKDPEAAQSLYMLTSSKEPMFVQSWKNDLLAIQTAIDDLWEVMDWLRAGKHFAESDRVRTIMSRLAKAIEGQDFMRDTEPDCLGTIARDFPEQISVKESKKLLARIRELEEKVAKMEVESE